MSIGEHIFFTDTAPWYLTFWHDFEAARGCRTIFTPCVAKKSKKSLGLSESVQENDIEIKPFPQGFASFNLDSPSDKLSADVKIRQALEPAGETLELRRTAGLACLKVNILGDNPGETHQYKF